MRIPNAYTKLDRTTGPQGPAAAGKDATTKSKEGASNAASTSVATSVNLSSRARELAAGAEPSAAKVSSLRDQIQRGTFKVDAQAIASKLVGDDP